MEIDTSRLIMLVDEPRKRCVDPDYHINGDDAWWVYKRKRLEQQQSEEESDNIKEDIVVVKKDERPPVAEDNMMMMKKLQQESVQQEKMTNSGIADAVTSGNLDVEDSLIKEVQKKKKLQMEKAALIREFEHEGQVHFGAATVSIACGDSMMKSAQYKKQVH